MEGQLWRWQGGTAGDESFDAAAFLGNGSVIVAGDTTGDWDTPNEGEADFAAAKFNADGTLDWAWQEGTSGEDVFAAIVAVEDGASVVLAGTSGVRGFSTSSSSSEEGRFFAAVKLDAASGSVLWRWENGTDSDDKLQGAVAVEDDSVVLVGHTAGDWAQDAASTGYTDFVAVKLDADKTELWRVQKAVTTGDDYARNAAAGEDGSVILSGYSESEDGEVDFAAMKVASNGTVVWTWNDGTTNTIDQFECVAGFEDGSVVLAGNTEGDWNGLDDAGFAAVKLNSAGTEMWRWQGGATGIDSMKSAAALEDGSVVLVGMTFGTWVETFADEGEDSADLAAVRLASDGTVVWEFQGGTELDDRWFGAAAESGGLVALAGKTEGNWMEVSEGGTDFVVLVLDANAGVTPSPTVAPTLSGTVPPSVQPSSSGTVPPSVLPPSSGTVPPSVLPPSSGTVPPSVLPPANNTSSGDSSSTDIAATIGGVAAAVAVVAGLLLLVVCRRRRILRKNKDAIDQPPSWSAIAAEPRSKHSRTLSGKSVVESRFPVFAGSASISENGAALIVSDSAPDVCRDAGRGIGDPEQPGVESRFRIATDANSSALLAPPNGAVGLNDSAADRHDEEEGISVPDAAVENTAEGDMAVTASTDGISTSETLPGYIGKDACVRQAGNSGEGDVRNDVESGGDGEKRSTPDLGVAWAVLQAAQQLSQSSTVPGVCEAATMVAVLVKLAVDHKKGSRDAEVKAKWCRSILLMLERAGEILGQNEETQENAQQVLIDDVRYGVEDLVELMKIYSGKNIISKVFTSSLFQRRQEEAEAAINLAIDRLQLGLHVQVGKDVRAVGQDVKEGLHMQREANMRATTVSANAESLVKARRLRRQRRLDQLEIPEDQLTLTDDVLGRGGFGTVYIADYNSRNAAAKVISIAGDVGDYSLDEHEQGEYEAKKRQSERRAFMRELEAMNRLRSPHTVHVYGAVTARDDQYILVMELLVGGDLRRLLKRAKAPLSELHARQIVGDICAGMAFLHRRATVHGDLKSANVLLDGSGRGKIGDFGTSSWKQHTMSTGLATYTADRGQHGRMSLPWAAPEVLTQGANSFSSDVYSFGIVVWEVLSREVPWADVSDISEIYRRVFYQQERPAMPANAPADLADVARACWKPQASERPAFSEVMSRLQASG